MKYTFECNLCGSDSGEKLLTIHKPDRFEIAYGINSDNYYRYWFRCNKCGSAVNIMSQESKKVVEGVASSYYEIDLGSLDKLQSRFEFVMNLPDHESDNVGRVNRILEYLKKHYGDTDLIELCDVGSGLGIFPAKILQHAGFNEGLNVHITAIEPDPVSFEFSKRLELFPVIKGYFPDSIGSKSYHVITLNKVLEHIEKPVDLMKDVASRLKKGGVTYVEVPCISNIRLKPPDDNSLGVLHCNLYSLATLSQILESAGLTNILCERIIEPSGKITVYSFAARF
jgi:hypothetical protein